MVGKFVLSNTISWISVKSKQDLNIDMKLIIKVPPGNVCKRIFIGYYQFPGILIYKSIKINKMNYACLKTFCGKNSCDFFAINFNDLLRNNCEIFFCEVSDIKYLESNSAKGWFWQKWI